MSTGSAMADYFDALAARALGTTSVVRPALVPRFAWTDDGPELLPSDEPDETALGGAPGDLRPRRDPPAPDADGGETARAERPDVEVAAEGVPVKEPRRAPPQGEPVEAAGPRPATPHRPDRVAGAERLVTGQPKPRPGRRQHASSRAEPADDLPPVAASAPPTGVGKPVSARPVTASSRKRPRPTPERGHRGRAAESPAPRGPRDLEGDAMLFEEPVRDDPHPVHVTVTIGRVEVHSPPKPAPPTRPQASRWPEPRLSLQDYLRNADRR